MSGNECSQRTVIDIYIPIVKPTGFKIYLCLRCNWYVLEVVTWRQLKDTGGNLKDHCSPLWAGARTTFSVVLLRFSIRGQLNFKEYAFHSSPPDKSETIYVYGIQEIVWQHNSDVFCLLVMPLPLVVQLLGEGEIYRRTSPLIWFSSNYTGEQCILLGIILYVSAKLSND